MSYTSSRSSGAEPPLRKNPKLFHRFASVPLHLAVMDTHTQMCVYTNVCIHKHMYTHTPALGCHGRLLSNRRYAKRETLCHAAAPSAAAAAAASCLRLTCRTSCCASVTRVVSCAGRRQRLQGSTLTQARHTSHATEEHVTRHTLHVTRHTSPAMLNANSVVTHTNSERRAAAHRDV